MMLSHSLISVALYKCMKHVSLLFCSWDAQVKVKSPVIIVRATTLSFLSISVILHMSEEKIIALLLYFVDKHKLYSNLKSSLKILWGHSKSRSLKIFCFLLNYLILCDLLH